MQTRHHVIFYSFLAVTLTLSILYGVRQGALLTRAETALEETYQSALADAVDHLNGLSLKLEKLMLTQEPGSTVLLLSQISRQAGEAQSRLAFLPLSHQAMGDAVRFCAQAGEYAQTLARRTAGGENWSQQDAQQLEYLASQAALLWGQLELSRQQMAQEELSFLGDRSSFYLNAQGDVRPVEQVYGSEMNYPTLIYDGAFSDSRHLGAPKGLPAGEITQAEAVAIARDFVGAERVTNAVQAPNTLGAIPAWGVAVQAGDVLLNVEVTRQGGKVLWMMPEHAEFSPDLTLEACQESAQAFLESRGFGEMAANHYQVYGGLATINFAAVQEGVILYTDQVKVQCRLDTGEVVGIEANNYWMNHVRREKLAPALTQGEARQQVSGKLTITDQRLCVIPYLGGERLCYEFAGNYEDSDYRVYIDALTGEQIELLKIIPVDNGVLSV